MWLKLYNYILQPAILNILKIYSFINSEIYDNIYAREEIFKQFFYKIKQLNPERKRLWIHCSSIGEYEQAYPLIQEIKSIYKNTDIILSIFSINSYKKLQTHHIADIITLLPLDKKQNAAHFISLIKPDSVIFINYDVWPNYLMILKDKKIPIVLVNGVLHQDSYRLKFIIRGFHRSIYKYIDYVLCADDYEKDNFEKLGYTGTIRILGDTRYDRIKMKLDNVSETEKLFKRMNNKYKKLIFASIEPVEYEMTVNTISKLYREYNNLQCIIVPHHTDKKSINRIESLCSKKSLSYKLYSNLNEDEGFNCRILIIDTIGILYKLYLGSDISYIGGGFSKSVHSVTEAGLADNIILFGPKYYNSHSARVLVKNNLSFEISNKKELYKIVYDILSDVRRIISLKNDTRDLLLKYTGASKRIVEFLGNNGIIKCD